MPEGIRPWAQEIWNDTSDSCSPKLEEQIAVLRLVNWGNSRVQILVVGKLCGQSIGVRLGRNYGANAIEPQPVYIHRSDGGPILPGHSSGQRISIVAVLEEP